ncbi:28S ribosomal protein S9, mitochondrial [Orussus abietinus]|uniref:28S ribosomal protein S9, mitochondrial n=1 Tax=Orussus abietinus TaxID=222816 RepID=UPI0006258940|nr:28S ribosomal protein S9, mitochondrial [Orussus abietinus]
MATPGFCVVLNRLFNLRTVTARLNNVWNVSSNTASCSASIPRLYSTETEGSQNESNEAKNLVQQDGKKLSKAMRAYLERAQAHDEFIQKENYEYQIGKRHLANIMGENPDLFSQKDIDAAIEYLFPSGLYMKQARPIMQPPEVIFPRRKAAEFDESGRPFHSMFYTCKPNYYESLYELVGHLNNLNAYEDEMIGKGLPPVKEDKINLENSEWLSKSNLELLLLENINDNQYDYFISSVTRLVEHPYSQRAKEFIMKFRKILSSETDLTTIPPLEADENGRPFAIVKKSKRKTALASVKVWGNGSGKITINDQSLDYFFNVQEREQILFPLTFTEMHDKVDVEATVKGGGRTGQSGAIRWGISWALRSFVNIEMIEKMKVAGLLQRDYRRRERKKPGQEGARRKFTWKKR